MPTSTLFLIPRTHTELLVIIFDHDENRSWTLVWESRGRLLSEVFERKADYFILSHNIFRKNYSFVALRMEKIHEVLWKSRFRVVAITFLSVFFGLLTWVADQGPSSTVTFSQITSNILKFWNWQLHDYREEYKRYLQGVLRYVLIQIT